MDGQIRVLSHLNGPIDADVMLIGEAPGRHGAGQSGVPFGGDESGRRLDRLIQAAGWERQNIFITNAVLCNPLDSQGRNRPPKAGEISNCRSWLESQIDVVDPLLVVALGAVALKSLGKIQPHPLTVRNSAAAPIAWNNRYLAGVYHPGARAAVHRPRGGPDFVTLSDWAAGSRLEFSNVGNDVRR